MLLKSITLTDFRNFKGTQSIDFADDSNRNVTVIMGENGSGKTTFAQRLGMQLRINGLKPVTISKSE